MNKIEELVSKETPDEEEFLEELRRMVKSPPEASGDEDRSSKLLFRRRAFYTEVWCYDEIVVARNETEAGGGVFAFQGAGTCVNSEGDWEVEDVEEISPDDLDEAEARKVAECVAERGEYQEVMQMNSHEIRAWLGKTLGVGKETDKEGNP